jgi:CRISPR-associated protein Cpf1
VHKLAQLVLKYNAVIVLEDLNGGFKRGRQKIEKSVYQKLELALAKKLGYLVLKDVALGEPGSATNAYQLCPLVSNFGDIKGKQR